MLIEYEQFFTILKNIDPSFRGKEINRFFSSQFCIKKNITQSGLYKSEKNEGFFVQFEDRVIAFGIFDKMFKQSTRLNNFRKNKNLNGKHCFIVFKLRNQKEFDIEKETILQLSVYPSFSNVISDFKYCIQMI